MNCIKFITSFFVQSVIITCAFSQEADSLSKQKYTRTVTVLSRSYSFPITRDTLNKYPDSIAIEARMVDYTLLGFSCGVVCGCGTLKLELTKGNNIYSEKFIYVGIPCLDSKDMVKKFRKTGTWKLYKILMDDRRCYWTEFPMNKFDTKGLPFYTFGKPHKGK